MTALTLSVLAAGAAVTDLRNGKIYNVWLIPGLLTGLFIRLMTGGWQGAGSGLVSLAMTLALLLPVYALRGLAGGDVKLLAALSVCVTPATQMKIIGISFAITAAYGILRILVTRKLRGRVCFALPVLVAVLFLSAGGLT